MSALLTPATIIGAYIDVTASRAFATNYTPANTRGTNVVATFRLNDDDGQTSTIDVLVDGVIIAPEFNSFNVSGLLGVTGAGIIQMPVTFNVPPGSIYRFNNSGAGTETITKVFEQAL